MSRKIFWCVILIFFLGNLLQAEEVFKGILKNLEDQPLVGVRVILKNTGRFTYTDAKGLFKLPKPQGIDELFLVFDPRGYKQVEQTIKATDSVMVFKINLISNAHFYERLSVTALSHEKKSVDIPMAETSVSAQEIQEKISENVMEVLSDTAGVHFIGKGGYAVTPTIRGLARRRVLMMLDGHRVIGDRRVGTSASFIPPELTKRIEVVRSSASVLYGSDAIGGVVNIMTRPNGQKAADLNALNLNFNSVNSRVNSGLTYGFDSGNWHFYTGFQYTTADDYSSPEEKILYSGYSYYAGILDITYSNEKRDFYLGYMAGFGRDVGKPERANDPNAYAVVPEESNQYIRMGLKEKQFIKNGNLELSLFMNPTTYLLDKYNVESGKKESSDTRASNLGLKVALNQSLSEKFSYSAGLEWFSRMDLDIENSVETPGEYDSWLPMGDGQRNDYSAFLTLNCALTPTLSMDGGIRYTFFDIRADVNGTEIQKDTSSASYFLGLTKKFSDSASIFLNVGRAFRLPSLSESFYTGMTGRKYVVGNPLLEVESSLNIDTGLKFSGKNYFVGVYAFTYEVKNLIERYKNDEGIYTYDNVHKGRIYGGEMEIQYSPVRSFNLFGHFFYYRGRSDLDDEPLNDIPAPRVFMGAKYHADRFWVELNYLHSFKKDDPGPSEQLNDAYNILNLKGGYYISSAWFIYVNASNLLNESYYANPDEDIPLAKGIGFSTGIHYYF